MKAIVIQEPNIIEMIEVEKPQIKNPTDVLVKIKAAGICGSDAGIYLGTNPFATYPRIPGHEIAGQVEEVGSEVTDLKPGDKVVLEPIEFCGECYACTHDQHNVCESLEVYGVHRDGGFMEYLVTDQSKWHKFDQSLDYAEGVVAEPYTIAEQSTSRAEIQEGDTVLVTGMGPTGLLIADIANDKGATVIISEVNENRRELAKEFGAKYTIDAINSDLTEEVMKITDNKGVNVFLDTSGVPPVIKEGVDLLTPAGRFVPLAFGDQDIPISYKVLNQKELSIRGTRLEFDKFPIVNEKLVDKKDKIAKFVTHKFPAEQYQEAFDEFTRKGTEAIKVVLTFD